MAKSYSPVGHTTRRSSRPIRIGTTIDRGSAVRPSSLREFSIAIRTACIDAVFGPSYAAIIMLRIFSVLIVLVCSVGAADVRADWPEFRGPYSNGHIAPAGKEDSKLPLTWSESENV